MGTTIRIDFYTLQRCATLPTSGVPQPDHLSVGADPNKAITHLLDLTNQHGIHQGAIDLSLRFNRGISHKSLSLLLGHPLLSALLMAIRLTSGVYAKSLPIQRSSGLHDSGVR